MTAGPTVGLVTVTFNSGAVLEDFLDSAARTEGIATRLYVVDNASSDGTVDRVKIEQGSKDVRLIANDYNAGVARANNQGIREAVKDGCQWVLLINNDTTFAPSLVADLCAVADQNSVLMLSPAIEATEPRGSIWYCGGLLRRSRGFQVVHEYKGLPMARRPAALFATEYAPTCCLLVHTSVFRKVGLMSEEYFVYSDDVDYAIRCRRAGVTCWVEPRLVLTHKASSLTGGPESPFGVAWTSRNWVLTARAHLSLIGMVGAIAFMEVWATARLLVRRDSPRTWFARQVNYLRGLRAPLPTVPVLDA